MTIETQRFSSRVICRDNFTRDELYKFHCTVGATKHYFTNTIVDE